MRSLRSIGFVRIIPFALASLACAGAAARQWQLAPVAAP